MLAEPLCTWIWQWAVLAPGVVWSGGRQGSAHPLLLAVLGNAWETMAMFVLLVFLMGVQGNCYNYVCGQSIIRVVSC